MRQKHQLSARLSPAHDLGVRARETPDAVAVADGYGEWSCGALYRAAQDIAQKFRGLALTTGSLVTITAHPHRQTVALLYGAWEAGLVTVPLHEKLTRSELAHARRLLRPAFHASSNLPDWFAAPNANLRPTPSSAHPYPSAPGAEDDPLPSLNAFQPHQTLGASPNVTTASNVIAFLLTSGTTGSATAVGLGHVAFTASCAATVERLDLRPGDCWGLCLSIAHVGGLAAILRAVMSGSSVRLWSSFDPEAVAQAIVDGQVTHLSLVPLMLTKIVKTLVTKGRRPHPALRCVLVGGAAMRPQLLERALEIGLPVATTWGMTETASQVATAPPQLVRRRPGTAGRPLRGVRVKVQPGGRLAVKGDTLASLVVKEPGASAEDLPRDSDGWFTTPDVGRVDADGLVWLDRRADSIIVSGGLNVSPAQVENTIAELAGVSEVVVFGVPDKNWGQVVAAVVEVQRGGPSQEEVDDHCRQRLTRGRCPTRITLTEALPRTPTGKVMRNKVIEAHR